MEVGNSSSASLDERLLLSLRYQQLEGVIQLGHKVNIRENWVDVVVNIDNIRSVLSPHDFMYFYIQKYTHILLAINT